MEDDIRLHPIIRVEDVSRMYRAGTREVPALRQVSLCVRMGTLVILRGRSGSGKTTLLNCIGGLDRPTNGRIWLNEQEVTALGERARVQMRRRHVGFVFQSHALLPAYSALENVSLMLRLARVPHRQRQARAEEVLELVGLGRWMDHRPYELSGGQQQRVAIARAIASRPGVILADEPTGELDTTTGQQILRLFRHIVDSENVTILIATHDPAADAFADEVYHLQDGRIVGQGDLIPEIESRFNG